jgi:hypothetical protein
MPRPKVRNPTNRSIKPISLFFICLFAAFALFCGSKSNEVTFCECVEGMLFASAIADAMGGPHEGRTTEVSQKFLAAGPVPHIKMQPKLSKQVDVTYAA